MTWSYGSWIYIYLCDQCPSPLKLWVWIPLRRGVLNTTLCDKVCQWIAAGQWFSPGTPISSTNKIDRHDITEILKNLNVLFCRRQQNNFWYSKYNYRTGLGKKPVPVVKGCSLDDSLLSPSTLYMLSSGLFFLSENFP